MKRTAKQRSASARQGWETRWSRGDNLGPKGQKFWAKRPKEDEYEFDYEGPVWEVEYEWEY